MRHEFSSKTKLAAFERADGHCDSCKLKIMGRAEYDHVIPCALGGEATLENCECLCRKCHALKTSGGDIPRISKAKRTHAKRIGAWPKPSRPIRSRGFSKREIEADHDS